MRLEIKRSWKKLAGVAPLLCLWAFGQQSTSSEAPSLASIVRGMEKAQFELRTQAPYQVIREYRLFGAKSSSVNAAVVAQVDFRTPTSKNYNIQKWSGSSRGKQIVQQVLDHEVEGSIDSQARSALTSDNYNFTLISDAVLDGKSCYLLGLKPKRKDKGLISGTAWVDKRSFLVLHVEGETAKAPSWWLKSVRVTLSFGNLSGTWLQTSMEAVADVRLLGSHTLTSHVTDYRGTDISASKTTAPVGFRLRAQNPRH